MSRAPRLEAVDALELEPEPMPTHDEYADDEPLPEIDVGPDESRVADDAEAALGAEPMLFARCGQLVRVMIDDPRKDRALLRPPSSPRIVHVSAATLREMLSRRATFFRANNEVHPPDFVVRALLDRGEWARIRRLRGVVDVPVLRPDGSIIQERGYDDATQLYVWGEGSVGPTGDTRDDALRARDELLEIVCDFPFERPAHQAAWLAAALTPFARYGFDGCVPLFAVDKNVRGAGGTLLADSIGVLATGRPMPRMIAAKDAEEERKRITAIALAGDPLVLIDNVAGTLGTDALDAALTSTTWRDRILGRSEVVTLPLSTMFLATGNNLVFGEDTLRRVCPIRIASPEERPEERTGFQHPRLLEWIRAERPRLVAAALTILRAYCAAGRPDLRLRPWGSFEEWSAVVRNAVAWIDLEDPGAAREELTNTADTAKLALANLIAGWRRMFGDAGGTVSAALAALEKDKREMIPKHSTLAEAIAELAPSPPGKPPSGLVLGKRMQRARGRVIGGLALDKRPGSSSVGVVWVVRQVVSGDGGDRGVVSPLAQEILDPSTEGNITTNTPNTTRMLEDELELDLPF